jgi:hypothetical protein
MYIVLYNHRYGTDVVGLFAFEHDAEDYIQHEIVDKYKGDWDDDGMVPTPYTWTEYTEGEEAIDIVYMRTPGWYKPKGDLTGTTGSDRI